MNILGMKTIPWPLIIIILHRYKKADLFFFCLKINLSSILGYKFNDGKMEEQEQYLKRISGLQRLYSAVLITKLRKSQQHLEHPHGLEYGWMWISNFIMLDPLPGISPTLLMEFIQTCGAEMWQIYKKQFMKILVVLNDQYMPKLERVRDFSNLSIDR